MSDTTNLPRDLVIVTNGADAELGFASPAVVAELQRLDQELAAAKRGLSEERSRARELWTALANLSFHCDGVVVTCPPPRTVYNQSFAVMDRFKPLYGPEAPKK